MFSTENELGQPKEPDITKARALLYETHGDGTQVRQRTVSLLTGGMKHRQQEMGMVFRHVDATERMLAERTARVNDTMKAANWMLQQRWKLIVGLAGGSSSG